MQYPKITYVQQALATFAFLAFFMLVTLAVASGEQSTYTQSQVDTKITNLYNMIDHLSERCGGGE